jgi:hypothetical protein
MIFTGSTQNCRYNLSAGRYKPFAQQSAQYDPPAQIIRELQEIEEHIGNGLVELLRMVETRG